MSCPYEKWDHTMDTPGCRCEEEDLVENFDEEVMHDLTDDELAEFEGDVIEMEWVEIHAGEEWLITTDTDTSYFNVKRDKMKNVWYVTRHPHINTDEDFTTLDAVEDALTEAEIKRFEEIFEPVNGIIINHTVLEDEEEADTVMQLFKRSNKKDTKKDDEKWKKGSSNTKYPGSGTIYTGNYSVCRHEPTPAFILHDVTYYGGSDQKVRWYDFDSSWLVVSLLGDYQLNYLTSNTPDLFKALNPLTSASSVLNIKWPDMAAPPVRKGFWLKLHEWVKANEEINKVIVYCMGGHGRTGTALSGVLVEASSYKPEDAVAFVRKHYCDRTVESSSQIEYLLSLYYDKAKVEEFMAKGGEKAPIQKSK